MRSIPEKQRPDIEAELRASIGDEIDARVESGEEDRSAEREVLSALGDPDRLAADLSGRPPYLVGPEHFFDYKRLVLVLLMTVVPIVMSVMVVSQVIGGGGVADVLGGTIGLGLSLVVHIVFWTTLVFALIERSDERVPTSEWTLSSLPPLPTQGSIKLGDTIGSSVFLVLAMVGLLVSRTVSPVTADDGDAIPIFRPDLWDLWLPLLVGILFSEIIFEVIQYRFGRWTWGLASVNLALNLAFVVPAIYLLTTDRLFNPEFFAEIGWSGPPQAGGTFVNVTVAVMALIASWDIVDGFRKARKAR